MNDSYFVEELGIFAYYTSIFRLSFLFLLFFLCMLDHILIQLFWTTFFSRDCDVGRERMEQLRDWDWVADEECPDPLHTLD